MLGDGYNYRTVNAEWLQLVLPGFQHIMARGYRVTALPTGIRVDRGAKRVYNIEVPKREAGVPGV
jgi:hypothetical protein